MDTQPKQYTRHDISRTIRNLKIDDKESVKLLQTQLNQFLGYPDEGNLKVDGVFGPNTKARTQEFLRVDEKVRQDSVFDAVAKDRLNFYRNWEFTTPKDTLEIKND